MDDFRVLTLEEQLSVTNSEFIDYLLQSGNSGGLGRNAKVRALSNWLINAPASVINRIIEKEIWFREIVNNQHLLIDIIGLIGSGKTTLGQMIAQSSGACVVPAYHVYKDPSQKIKFVLDENENQVPYSRTAGFLGELPDVQDILPDAASRDALNALKLVNEKILRDLYKTKNEKILLQSSLRIQKAYLSCRGEQAHLVDSLRKLSYKLLITRDGSPFSDRFMFTEKFIDDGTLEREFVEIVDNLFKISLKAYKPDFVIMYRSTIDECLNGVQLRQRDIELQKGIGVDREYLEGLEKHIKKIPSILDEYKISHIDLRRVDFMNNPEAYIIGVLDLLGNKLMDVIRNKAA